MTSAPSGLGVVRPTFAEHPVMTRMRRNRPFAGGAGNCCLGPKLPFVARQRPAIVISVLLIALFINSYSRVENATARRLIS